MNQAVVSTIKLPRKQVVAARWLAMVSQLYLTERQTVLKPVISNLLRHFYEYVDNGTNAVSWDLRQFTGSSDKINDPCLRDQLRVLITLRSALKDVLSSGDLDTLAIILDRFDHWLDTSLDKLNGIKTDQLQKYQIISAQQMESLHMLTRFTSMLNASLDLATALNAAVNLSLELAEADLSVVYILDESQFVLEAMATCKSCVNLPEPQRTVGTKINVSGDSVQLDAQNTVIIDELQQDLPIEVPRTIFGINDLHAVICVPLCTGRVTIGKLTVAYLSPQRFPIQKIRQLEIFASSAGQAIFNAQLHERLGELMITQERQRIACEMHDTMLQTLVSLNINLRVGIHHAMQEKWDDALKVLEAARHLGKLAITEGRETLQSLRTDYACDGGREKLLAILQPEISLFTVQTGIKPIVEVEHEISVCSDVGHQLRRIVGEALTNICRHSQASSAYLSARIIDSELVVRISDDGVGFLPERANDNSSFGISGMRERARLINANLKILSEFDKGTLVEIRCPYRAT